MAKKNSRAAPEESPAQQLLAFAREKAPACETWIDLNNAVYGIGGRFAQLFPTQPERAAFMKTGQARELDELIGSLPGPPGWGGSGEAVGGKFLLRLPLSLHKALVAEAEAEGVSLNQLCLAKLAVQLRAMV